MSEDMDQYIPKLVEAIAIRRSRRKYLPKPLEKDHKKKLEAFLEVLQVPFDHSVNISMYEVPENCQVLKLNSKINDIAAVTAPTTILDEAKSGFLGELFILYATSIGVSNCWYGNYKRKGAYQAVYGTPEKAAPKKIHSLILLGYAPEKYTRLEKFSIKVGGLHKRKSVDEKLYENSLENFPDFIRTDVFGSGFCNRLISLLCAKGLVHRGMVLSI